MTNAVRITFLYSLFALLSMTINLVTQALFMTLYHGLYAMSASILSGTIVGLGAKYILDKHYIFIFESKDLAHDSKLFFLYAMMGIFTTTLFWAVEYAFQRIFGGDFMRYVGGAIGLIIGYVIKYHLDMRFVFVSKASITSDSL